MNWDAIGAVGEILGAIGVIVTLLYLSTQMRQNTKAMRSSTYQAYSASSMHISDYLSDNSDLMVKVLNNLELNPSEQVKLRMFGSKLFSQMEAIYLHHKEGAVDDEVFDARMRGFKKTMEPKAFTDIWAFYKDYDLTTSFVEYVDREVLGDAP